MKIKYLSMLLVSLTAQAQLYQPYIRLGAYHFSEDPRSGVSLESFLPLYQTGHRLFYADLRALDKNKKAWEANLGLGYRHLSRQYNRLFGFYLFYDRQRSPLGHYFNQATLGGEFWQNRWTVNANLYLPFGRTRYDEAGDSEAHLDGEGLIQQIIYNIGQDVAYHGTDFLMGYEWYPGLISYVGGYYFDRGQFPKVSGPMLRLQYRYKKPVAIFQSLDVIAEVQRDKERGSTWFAGIKAAIPLRFHHAQAHQRYGVERHMDEQVIRDIDIISQKTRSPDALLTNSDGSPVLVALPRTKNQLISALANTQVTVVAPQNDISDLADLSLSSGQTLTGSDYSFSINGRPVDLVVSAGETPELTSAADSDLITSVGKDNTIRNLNLTLQTPLNHHVILVDENSADDIGTLLLNNIYTDHSIDVDLSTTQTGSVNMVSSSIFGELIVHTDDLGVDIQHVGNKADFITALNNPAITDIAVQGHITLDNAIVLPAGKSITAGYYEHNNMDVRVSYGGALTAPADSDLIDVSGDNTIRDITLNVDTNADKNVIYNTATAVDLGTIRVENITSNGGTEFNLDGASAAMTLYFDDNTISNSYARGLRINADNAANVTLAGFHDNNIDIAALEKSALDLRSSTTAHINVSDGIRNNVIASLTETVLLYTPSDGTINVVNGIDNNNITGDGDNALRLQASALTPITVDHITNNTFTSDREAVMIFSSNTHMVNITDGFIDNVLISTTIQGIRIFRGLINGFHGNSISGSTVSGTSLDMRVHSSNITVDDPLNELNGLVAANAPLTYTNEGGNTITPGF